MEISIIIPTYNRAPILQKCLSALKNQSYPQSKYEIIVVDDGSTDKTAQVVKSAFTGSKIHHQYYKQKNQGQGIARNLGINKAQGKILFFIGDDMITDPKFIEKHMALHKKFTQKNIGVIGYIDWHPELKINPFMKWLTNGSSIFGRFGGHQFAFEKLKNKEDADYNFFYTSNLSLKKEILSQNQFDSDFHNYGWEDIELGYRLTKTENLVLKYQPQAITYHLHQMEMESLKKRMYLIGLSSHIFHQKHPELNKVPSLIKKILLYSIANPLSIFTIKHLQQRFPKLQALYFYSLSKKYFLQGIKDGYKQTAT